MARDRAGGPAHKCHRKKSKNSNGPYFHDDTLALLTLIHRRRAGVRPGDCARSQGRGQTRIGKAEKGLSGVTNAARSAVSANVSGLMRYCRHGLERTRHDEATLSIPGGYTGDGKPTRWGAKEPITTRQARPPNSRRQLGLEPATSGVPDPPKLRSGMVRARRDAIGGSRGIMERSERKG